MEMVKDVFIVNDIKQSVLFCPIVQENKLPIALILEME